MSDSILPLLPLFLLAAALYASVGHGGASAYLAIFALAGIASPAIAPAALILNIVAASISFWSYRRAGHFSAKLLLPFVLTSIPASLAGAMIHLSQPMYSLILGVALLLAAVRMLLPGLIANRPEGRDTGRIRLSALLIGLLVGLVSGAVGIGGGVFLSPLLLLFGWADVKRTAAVSSAFIVLNSLAGIAGHAVQGNIHPWPGLYYLAAAVGGGAILGSLYSTRHLAPRKLQVALGLVLMLASVKLLVAGLPAINI